MSVTRACCWHCHCGRALSLTPPLATGSTGTTKKLWGLHGSYSYIVNTSSSNPCSENNQIFRLSNCFSCLVTSSPTMSAFENASGLASELLCVWVCGFSFPPCGPLFFLSQKKWFASCYALELPNTFIYDIVFIQFIIIFFNLKCRQEDLRAFWWLEMCVLCTGMWALYAWLKDHCSLNETTVCSILDADIGFVLNLENTDHMKCVCYRDVIPVMQLSLKKNHTTDKRSWPWCCLKQEEGYRTCLIQRAEMALEDNRQSGLSFRLVVSASVCPPIK